MFQKIISDLPINEIPVILIDTSGSTSDKFKSNKISGSTNDKFKQTVREYEFELALNICTDSNYTKVHIITWNSVATLYENQDIKNISKIRKRTESSGGTELICGLKLIKDDFFDKNTITRIIIITDGEISDDNKKICDKLNQLSQHNMLIEIIAVETNNNDYSNANVSVGNAIYRMIKKNNMTRLVNKFSVYNRNEIEFVNFSNPRVKEGFIPYYNTMFSITDLKKFIEHVNESVKEILNKNRNMNRDQVNINKYSAYLNDDAKKIIKDSDKSIELEIIKFSQNLALSLYHITKNQLHQQQLSLIELFSNMFKETEYYTQVRSILLNEVNNHVVGKASTYQELRKRDILKLKILIWI